LSSSLIQHLNNVTFGESKSTLTVDKNDSSIYFFSQKELRIRISLASPMPFNDMLSLVAIMDDICRLNNKLDTIEEGGNVLLNHFLQRLDIYVSLSIILGCMKSQATFATYQIDSSITGEQF
jgi:hypothetical protein